MTPTWDLSALVNAADPKAGQAERHLWLVRLLEWLRHAPAKGRARADASVAPQLARLGLLLKAAETQPEFRARLQQMLERFWREIDKASLFAEFGFGARHSLFGEVGRRLRVQWLPQTPDTPDLAELFQLLFRPEDMHWIAQLDDTTLQRVAALIAPGDASGWRPAMLDAITILVSAVHSSGFLPPLRRRMDRQALAAEPFRQLTRAADAVREAVVEGRHADALREASFLRALLDACRQAADSVTGHLEEYGVSVDIVYELDQMRCRTLRIEALLNCVLAPAPLAELRALVLELLHVAEDERGLRRLLARHYSLLARQVAERSAETGAHYITRNRAEWRAMLGAAAGGGAVIAGTTYLKFAIGALGLAAFWNGFWAGANYAASFVLIMLLHWTVATKQPAMTAPAMAEQLTAGIGDAEVEAFVDRVAQLIRSQAAGIIGNLAVCGPLALAIQLAWEGLFGVPLVGENQAEYVLHSLTLLGPTLFYAAFTGVLLFSSSLVAGWAENWFVYHRLDSAIAWNPRFVARLGALRAQRWAAWWRRNVSGIVANVSLGMMLGLVPALASFFALPLEVRHVTLSTGQLAAAAGALGLDVLRLPAFWWCVAGIVLTGVLNVSVSFWLAFKVAARSRGIQVRERKRIAAAIARRLRRDPLSFVRPPKDA
ncbi:recombinase [Rubrivivax gelatinosus]|nr:recombinase [Rubrivivax gelatinosus]